LDRRNPLLYLRPRKGFIRNFIYHNALENLPFSHIQVFRSGLPSRFFGIFFLKTQAGFELSGCAGQKFAFESLHVFYEKCPSQKRAGQGRWARGAEEDSVTD
jgi:hypothetical protein